MKKRTAVLSISALTCMTGTAVAIQPAAGASAAAAPVAIFVDHNVEARQSAIDAAVAQAIAVGAHGITLQEVCSSQASALYNQYGASWSINYATDNPQKPNCGGQPGGTVAIWTGGPTGADEDIPITVDGGRTPNLTCVRFPSNIVNHVCSAHLVAADADGVRDQQTGDIKRATDP